MIATQVFTVMKHLRIVKTRDMIMQNANAGVLVKTLKKPAKSGLFY